MNPYDMHGLYRIFDNGISVDPTSWPNCCGVPLPPIGAILRINRRPRKHSYFPSEGRVLVVTSCNNVGGVNSHQIQVCEDLTVLDHLSEQSLESICYSDANASCIHMVEDCFRDGISVKDLHIHDLFVGYGLDDGEAAAGKCNLTDICFDLIGFNLHVWGKYTSFLTSTA